MSVEWYKVVFIRENWSPVRETGRFIPYSGDSRIIRESWHKCAGGGGGRPGKGGGFDCNHRPVVGFFDRFNDLSSNILLTFGCYFDNPQCSGVGHLNKNSQFSSNAPPMPGLPPQRLNIDRCIRVSKSWFICLPSLNIEN